MRPDSPNKGKAFLGIYEAKDTNSLRVCDDLSGAAFPAKLESATAQFFRLRKP